MTFVVLSLLFGTLLILVNPPLRGPDEKAHFLRVYGLAQGDLVPTTEIEGRLGTWMPAEFHDELRFFIEALHRFGATGESYFVVFSEYVRRDEGAPAGGHGGARPPVFEIYEGSEGYSPVPYLAYIPVAFAGILIGLDFFEMLYLMRLAGLLFTTAVIGFAIAVTPHLKWAMLLIAMLPAPLYGRAVVSADGATFAFTLTVLALALNAADRTAGGREAAGRALWMSLAVVAKPPQIVFVLFELMRVRVGDLPRVWRTQAVVVLPGAVLGALWVYLSSGRVATWRLVERTGLPEREFDLGWKLVFMAEHPMHFPVVLLTSLYRQAGDLWIQAIGVLGWLDTPLWNWIYPALTVLLLLVTAGDRLDARRATRWRIGGFCLLACLAYLLAVYLIFFLTWTPSTAQEIWGVQGRYFVVTFPAIAVVIAAFANVRAGNRIVGTGAILGAAMSGIASIEAVCRVNWLAG